MPCRLRRILDQQGNRGSADILHLPVREECRHRLSSARRCSCQSGVWASGGGGGVTVSGGVAQLWKAVAGQTIGCTWSNWRAEAMVDAAGIYYSRVRDLGWGGDSGWVVGVQVYAPADGSTFSVPTIARTNLGGVTLDASGVFRCRAEWA